MSVMVVKCELFNPATVGSDSGNSLKSTNFASRSCASQLVYPLDDIHGAYQLFDSIFQPFEFRFCSFSLLYPLLERGLPSPFMTLPWT